MKKSWNLRHGKLKIFPELTNKQVFNCQNKLWKSLSVSYEWDLSSSKCCSCYRKWDLVAHHSKVNEEARLMKKNVCFLLDANNQSEGRMNTYPKADPYPLKVRGQDFLYTERGATCRDRSVSSDSRLEIHHQSDQHHLDCLRYDSSSVPTSESVCYHFFESTSRNSGSLCHDYSLAII